MRLVVGRKPRLTFLIESGRVNAPHVPKERRYEPRRAIINAAGTGHTAIVEKLLSLKGVDVDTHNVNRTIALQVAVASGNLEMVRFSSQNRGQLPA